MRENDPTDLQTPYAAKIISRLRLRLFGTFSGMDYYQLFLVTYCLGLIIIYFSVSQNTFRDQLVNVKFYLLLANFVFLIVAFYIKRNIRVYVLIIITTIGAFAYSFEFYLRNLGSMNDVMLGVFTDPVAQRMKFFGEQAFDRRSKFEIVAELRRQGIDAYPHVTPLPFLDDSDLLPLGGISNRTTVLCNESGEYFIYESDEFGFNNPSGVWQRDTVDVAFLGDSITHGACVTGGNGFVDVVRRTYANTLNLGISSSGPLIQYAVMREYLTAIEPKVVIWVYFENDLDNLEREKMSRSLYRYLEDSGYSQRLYWRQQEIDLILRSKFKEEYELAQRRSVEHDVKRKLRALIDALTLARAREALVYRRMRVSDRGREIDLFAELLKAGRDLAATWRGRVYFVYVPAWDSMVRREGYPERAQVLEVVKTLGLTIIDVYDIFRSRPRPECFYPACSNGHLNAAGSKIVAAAIVQTIRDGFGE